MDETAASKTPRRESDQPESFKEQVHAATSELNQLQRRMRRQQQVDSATLEQIFGI